jgi:hypothetical protein
MKFVKQILTKPVSRVENQAKDKKNPFGYDPEKAKELHPDYTALDIESFINENLPLSYKDQHKKKTYSVKDSDDD